jgi:uncharacterized protein
MPIHNYSSNTPLDNPLQPISNASRIDLLDVLRGFAICGILLGNIPFFMGYYMSSAKQAMFSLAVADKVTILLIHFFIEGKFYSLFSLLFGIGFSIQLSRASEKGQSFLPHYVRRLTVLFFIGIVHLLLIWSGDILTSYAITGFILLIFRNRSDQILLRWAFFLLLLPVLQYALVMAVGGGIHPGTIFTMAGSYFRHYFGLQEIGGRLTLLQGDYYLIVQSNIVSACFRFSDLLYTGRFFKILAMFLLGYYVGRKQLFKHLEANQSLLKKLLIWGFALGIPTNLVLVWLMELGNDHPPSFLGLSQSFFYAIGVVPLSLAYTSLFAILWQKPAWKNKLRFFAPIGKMALSNYLLQSLICVWLFYGFGFNLIGKLGPFVGMGIAVLILTGEYQFSRWWLSRYQFGPLEWVWRSLTYGKWQKLKHASGQVKQD